MRWTREIPHKNPLTRNSEDFWLRAPGQTPQGCFPAGCTVNLRTFPKGFSVPPVGGCGENGEGAV